MELGKFQFLQGRAALSEEERQRGATRPQLCEMLQQHRGMREVSKALVLEGSWHQRQTLHAGNGGRKLKNNSGGELHQLLSMLHLLLY